MPRLILIALLAAAGWFALKPDAPTPVAPLAATVVAADSGALDAAIAQRSTDVQVSGDGTVERVLPDDEQGSRHQRFILRLASGRTLLVAHNIDLAPRIDDLRVGDPVAFSGEYVWNRKGGVLHWTHRDPAGRHVGGWLRRAGRTYQ
jgi:hypothetical protein